MVLSAFLLTTGCARFESRPLSAEQAAGEFASRTLHDIGLRHFIETNRQEVLPEWPLSSWDFSHLTLAAFYFHPDLDVARAQWAKASAGRVAAGERPNPTLGVAPGYNTTQSVPTPWFVTASLDVPIETAGKRGYRLARAAHLSEAAQQDLAMVAWRVRSRLRQSLVELEAAKTAEEYLRQQVLTQERIVGFLEARQKAGESSPYEIAESRVALDRIRLSLHDADRRHREAVVRLAAAVGIPTGALDKTILAFGSLASVPAALPSAVARRLALMQRADVLSALATYAASESALQLEIAKQFPDVHLSPGYKYDQGDNEWSLGLSVALPVLNQNQGAIAQAEAHRAEMAAQFNALQARVVGEIDLASAVYSTALAKAQAAEALYEHVGEQENAARRRFEAGEISRFDLTLIQTSLNQANLAVVEARAQAQQALGALEDAVQSPLTGHESWQPPLPSAVAARDIDTHD